MMTKQYTPEETLAHAREQRPRRLRAQRVFAINVKSDETLSQHERDVLAKTWRCARRYFRRFAESPQRLDENGERVEGNMIMGANVCLGCGSVLDGFVGTFRYSIVHGEGECSICGYPVRTHHYVKDDDGNELLTLTQWPIQYHPDDLQLRTEADE